MQRSGSAHRYPVALAIAGLLLVALVVIGIRSFEQMRENLAALDRTHRVGAAASRLDITLLDMKTSQRRYLMTRADAAMALYVAAASRLDHALEIVSGLVPPDEAVRLRERVAAFRDELSTSMAITERDGLGAAMDQWRSERGNGRLDEIRALLTGLEDRAANELAAREQRAADSVRHNQWVAAALIGALLLLLVLSAGLMRAEARARHAAADANQRAMRMLEARVAERTRALERATVQVAVGEAHLRGIFDSANEAILSVSPEQAVVTANAAAAQTFGHPVERLVGMPLDALIPARFRAQHRVDLEAFGASATAARPMGRRADVVALHADGHEFPIEASISTVHVDGQRFHTVVLRDISARRLADAQLREAELRQRRLLSLLPEGVFVNTDGRISYVNEAAQRLFGDGEAALIGRDPLDLMHPESRPLVRERIAALLQGEPLARLAEIRVLRADGGLRWVESTATTIDEDGRRSIVVVLRDITELRRVREALAASHADLRRLMSAQTDVQEMERARIARELHDDLQQSLAAIKMDLAAAAERIGSAPAEVGPLLANARDVADAVIVSTRRIVNDLRPQLLDDLGLAAALQALAAQFAQRTGITCDFDDRANELLEALAPPVALCLFRIAQEALNNVVKHADAGLVTITLHEPGHGRVALQIDDDGRGISDRDRLKGGSFGLLGMRERVASIGGTIRVSERPGGGTRVAVEVPVVPDPPPTAPADLSA